MRCSGAFLPWLTWAKPPSTPTSTCALETTPIQYFRPRSAEALSLATRPPPLSPVRAPWRSCPCAPPRARRAAGAAPAAPRPCRWCPTTRSVSWRAVDVDDLGVEDLGDLQRLGALFALAGDPHQHQLGGHRVVRLEVADLDDVDELVELLRHLVDRVLVAVDHDGDAREARVLAQADGQALDVEAAPGEEPGDPREHAGLVLDEDGERVLHDFFPLAPGPPIISVISWPAGTIG